MDPAIEIENVMSCLRVFGNKSQVISTSVLPFRAKNLQRSELGQITDAVMSSFSFQI